MLEMDVYARTSKHTPAQCMCTVLSTAFVDLESPVGAWAALAGVKRGAIDNVN